MKVQIVVDSDVIWMRDAATQEGIASRGYVKDGTQHRIITALEDALAQAKGEQLCWGDTHVVTPSQQQTDAELQ